MSHFPLLEPVVLITSVPPGSLGRKKRHRHALESTHVGKSRKKLCFGPSSVPSARFEVLLPPIGSWKSRLPVFGSSDKVRTVITHSVCDETDTLSKDPVRLAVRDSDDARQTVVTPRVYDLAVTMFQQGFRVMKPLNHSALSSYSHPLTFTEIHGASLTMKWVGLPSVYSAIRIGKTIYQVFVTLFRCQTYIN